MGSVFLLLGSNQDDRVLNLHEARQQISRSGGKIITVSSVYQTEVWGDTARQEFYNQAIEIQPIDDPHKTLYSLLEIEKKMGRVRKEKWGDRLIDIDILLWEDQQIHQADLIVPHPYLHLRRFALIPLAEIAPGAIHPGFNKSIAQLLDECPDTLRVDRIKL